MCQDGYTPCYVASSHVQLDCLKVLIEANAGVNKANTVSVWWKNREKDYTITGLPLTWKTWKPGKVREFQWDFSKSGNLPKKSENLRQNSKRQGKVREFCCLKFIFSQVEEPNFKNCQGEHAPRPPNGLRLMVELYCGLLKSQENVREFHIVWKVATLLLTFVCRSFKSVIKNTTSKK